MNWHRITKGIGGIIISVAVLSALQVPAPWQETQPWGYESNAPGPKDPVDPLTGNVYMSGEVGPAHELKEAKARIQASIRRDERREKLAKQDDGWWIWPF